MTLSLNKNKNAEIKKDPRNDLACSMAASPGLIVCRPGVSYLH